MNRLILVYAYPSESNPHGTLGMLFNPDYAWIKKQLRRIDRCQEQHNVDENLAHMDYWGGHFPVLEVYGDDKPWPEEMAEELEDSQILTIGDEISHAIEHATEDHLRLDVARIRVYKDGIMLMARGKHNDLYYETDSISKDDLEEILKELE